MRIALVAAWLLAYAVFVIAQTCYEATGQTQVFTLAAGSKAGWTSVSQQGRAPHSAQANARMTILAHSDLGGMDIRVSTGTATGELALFSASGRMVRERAVSGDAIVAVVGLPTGLHFAWLLLNGRGVQTTRFMVSR